ncbi:alpha,alpha-trehalase TreF [Luteimonas sp. 50]|uniref:Alpha,alpha-trehalase TreF n=1 Tax=Cognatiluteimonas sedimenti TaxID=2927791 RepID=A0ABT0A6M6_9GAMM|nr:alpha,alpha-trehalase TreF [Lysobacter sedimenti]MCJ0826595.1 alpha,alpha-trehalase TreF [Lysobacter sedimenti]
MSDLRDAARRDDDENNARAAAVAAADPLGPADRYGDLFVAVQSARVFADSKTFVDCAPLGDPDDIVAAWQDRKARPGFDLAGFVRAHFRAEHPPASHYVSDPEQTLVAHIDGLWDVLTRQPREHPGRSSLLPLPNPYVVPGGRFGEMYYWDSYFTMLGLAASGRHDLLRDMADNFAYLIDTYGHVPNGNRSYYLSRSQPPVFALMVELFERDGVRDALRYLPRLRREYDFWMQGSADLRRGEAGGHCVRMDDGALLNRYWDARDIPREEAWAEDVATAARQHARPAAVVYRELRAAAASGWDFSSRWCEEGGGLETTRTTTIVPVDLNAFLHKLEVQVARLSADGGDEAAAADFRRRARARARAVERWLWNPAAGTYLDYDLLHDRPRVAPCAAAAAPLYVGLATPGQAHGTAAALAAQLLQQGGLATTGIASGEQWDRPNGWAPLQWLAIVGCARYGLQALADDIRERWLATVGSLYRREGKLVEKYALQHAPDGARGGDGGEYPLQDGFGWTNGVTRRLLHAVPRHPACRVRAARRN